MNVRPRGNPARRLCDAVIEAPDAVRQHLAEVAEDRRQPGMRVEDAARHQPQGVRGGLDAERPRGAPQPWVAVVDRYPARQRVARVEIERHVQRFDGRPERPVDRVVVIDDGLGVAHLRNSRSPLRP